MTERAARTAYHHGNLRAALIAAALDIVAAKGADALSVAEAAKRTGVSAGAPYRHFPSRLALLTAVATEAAREFDEQVRTALPPPGGAARDAVASTADSYVRFVVRRRIGWDVLFGQELAHVEDAEKNAATRALSDTFLAPALAATGGDVKAALTLLERVLAAAHGYAALYLAGMYSNRYPDVSRAAAQAAAIAAALVAEAQK